MPGVLTARNYTNYGQDTLNYTSSRVKSLKVVRNGLSGITYAYLFDVNMCVPEMCFTVTVLMVKIGERAK